MTSHAAVVARGMGKPCVAGAGDVAIDDEAEHVHASARHDRQGRRRASPSTAHRRGDARRGADRRAASSRATSPTLMGWADKIRTLKVRTNADTPLDASTAREFGAEGIGLCRTEHMFFEADRIVAMREMILADDERGPARGARQAPADAARGLRRHLRDHGRPAGDHPPARPAAARVPAARRRAEIEEVAEAARRRRRRASQARVERAARDQPDARPSRLPARHHLSRDLRDAGARDHRGGASRSPKNGQDGRCPRS